MQLRWPKYGWSNPNVFTVCCSTTALPWLYCWIVFYSTKSTDVLLCKKMLSCTLDSTPLLLWFYLLLQTLLIHYSIVLHDCTGLYSTQPCLNWILLDSIPHCTTLYIQWICCLILLHSAPLYLILYHRWFSTIDNTPLFIILHTQTTLPYFNLQLIYLILCISLHLLPLHDLAILLY